MSRTNRTKEPSKSSQLRTAYYKLWEKDDEGFADFNEYYNSKMDKLISHFTKLSNA